MLFGIPPFVTFNIPPLGLILALGADGYEALTDALEPDTRFRLSDVRMTHHTPFQDLELTANTMLEPLDDEPDPPPSTHPRSHPPNNEPHPCGSTRAGRMDF